MPEDLRSFLIGTSGLSALLALALVLSIARPFHGDDARGRDRLLRLFLLGVAMQCLHAAEEFATELHARLPEVLGFAPWSPEVFVVFNLAWIAIWTLSAVALRAGSSAAMFPVWFFALAMSFNGVLHPLLAVRAGGYFPGLVTSPIVGVLGALLLIQLFRITARGPSTAPGQGA